MVIEQAYNSASNVLNLKLQGEIDVTNTAELKEILLSGIETKSPNLLLDCADLSYIDSTGLGVMVSALKKSMEKGGEIKIIHLKPYLKKLFSITALDQIFQIEEVSGNER